MNRFLKKGSAPSDPSHGETIFWILAAKIEVQMVALRVDGFSTVLHYFKEARIVLSVTSQLVMEFSKLPAKV